MNLLVRTTIATVIATALVAIFNMLVRGTVDIWQTTKSAIVFAAIFFVLGRLFFRTK